MAKDNGMDAPVALESILYTDELNRRPLRPPDYKTENGALVGLAQALADAPRIILQTLADTILEVLRCDSAGISLVTEDGTRFYWPAISGVWKPHLGGGTPRDFGPCGDVLDRDIPLLFKHFERRYTYFLPVTPPVEECLLAPFYVDGKPVGTIWASAHDDRRKFDNEDLRQLVSLSRFACSPRRRTRRYKNSLQAASFETWTSYANNTHNQKTLVVNPEGDSIAYAYEDETNTITFPTTGGVHHVLEPRRRENVRLHRH